jgi:glycosyltransferase involved in cell wall biosynthesis
MKRIIKVANTRRKKILMACPGYWKSPFQVGSHHLARGFIKAGWDVAFISDPISPLHFIGEKNKELLERFDEYKAGGSFGLNGHLWTYVPGALLTPNNRPLLRTDWVNCNWSKLTLPSVIKKIRKAGFDDVDLLYFDSVNFLFLLKTIKHKKSVLRIADRNTGFDKHTLAAQKLEHELARSVDTVIYSAQSLSSYVQEMHPRNALHVPNGVNFRHFAEGSDSLPVEYHDIPKPIALYVGAMDVWFDYELVNKLADRLPNISFVLIGPDQYARTRLKRSKNLYLLGRQDYANLPSYMKNADVGIIPFNTKEHRSLVQNIHPLKLYEYMACGLPVVAVEWQELSKLRSPASLCQTTEQFAQSIENAVSDAHNKELYIKYAENMDWSKRVEKIAMLAGGLNAA